VVEAMKGKCDVHVKHKHIRWFSFNEVLTWEPGYSRTMDG